MNCHPLFWNYDARLKFLLDVSDRLENLPLEDKLVQAFERGAGEVSITHVKFNTTVKLSHNTPGSCVQELTMDLLENFY